MTRKVQLLHHITSSCLERVKLVWRRGVFSCTYMFYSSSSTTVFQHLWFVFIYLIRTSQLTSYLFIITFNVDRPWNKSVPVRIWHHSHGVLLRDWEDSNITNATEWLVAGRSHLYMKCLHSKKISEFASIVVFAKMFVIINIIPLFTVSQDYKQKHLEIFHLAHPRYAAVIARFWVLYKDKNKVRRRYCEYPDCFLSWLWESTFFRSRKFSCGSLSVPLSWNAALLSYTTITTTTKTKANGFQLFL